jgi:hypothetical protein
MKAIEWMFGVCVILFRTGETGLLHDLAPTDHLGLHKCL